MSDLEPLIKQQVEETIQNALSFCMLHGLHRAISYITNVELWLYFVQHPGLQDKKERI